MTKYDSKMGGGGGGGLSSDKRKQLAIFCIDLTITVLLLLSFYCFLCFH